MSKVKITSSIVNVENNYFYEVFGILNKKENKITYFETDELKTKVTYSYNTNTLIRENKNLYMKYTFNKNKETKGLLEIKDIKRTLEVTIKTKNIERKNNDLKIDFLVEEEEFSYKVEVKENE